MSLDKHSKGSVNKQILQINRGATPIAVIIQDLTSKAVRINSRDNSSSHSPHIINRKPSIKILVIINIVQALKYLQSEQIYMSQQTSQTLPAVPIQDLITLEPGQQCLEQGMEV
jgi:hypothetical protein